MPTLQAIEDFFCDLPRKAPPLVPVAAAKSEEKMSFVGHCKVDAAKTQESSDRVTNAALPLLQELVHPEEGVSHRPLAFSLHDTRPLRTMVERHVVFGIVGGRVGALST